MEQMRAAVLSACMLSAAVGICSLIRPGKALERQIRFVISLLFVISLTVPLTQMEVPPELEVLAEERAVYQEGLDAGLKEALLAETKRRTEEALTEQLAAAGITCTKMEAILYIDETGCIYCSDISAECSDFAGACAILEAILGEGVNICVTEVLS